ncbi:MAG: hypothetical protein ACK5NW_00935, partial [Ottowia sp.]
MNEFDQAVAGLLPMGDGDDYSQAVQQSLQPTGGTSARLGFLSGFDRDPDSYAEARRVAQSTGVPVDTVLALPKEMKKQAAMGSIDFDALAATSPAAAALLADVEKASVAHDDVASLRAVEEAVFARRLGDGQAAYGRIDGPAYRRADGRLVATERGFFGAVAEPVQRGWALGRAGESIVAQDSGLLAGWQRKQREAAEAHGVTYNPLAEAAGIVASRVREAERFPMPNDVAQGMQAITGARSFSEAGKAIAANPGAVGEVVLQSLGMAAPGMAAGLAGAAVGGPWGAALGAGVGSAATEYAATLLDTLNQAGVNTSDRSSLSQALADDKLMSEARSKGVRRGLAVGTFDALTAGFAGRLLAGAAPTAISQTLRAGGELAMQAAGGAAGEAAAGALTGEFNPGEILLEAVAEMPTSLHEVPANFISGARRAQQIDATARYRATQAAQSAELLTRLTEASKASKLLAREPDTFEQFVAQAADGGPVESIYLDANVLMQSGLAPQLAEVSPSVAEQITEAGATGGQIAIPVAEYAARIAPTELSAGLLDHLKTDPDGFSRVEAQAYMETQGERLQADMAEAMGKAVVAEQTRASQDVVRTQVLDQLNAAGRNTATVNDAYASLVAAHYATRAEQLGVTPEELFERRPLRVVAEGVSGGFSQEMSAASAAGEAWRTELARVNPDNMDYVPKMRTPTVLATMGLKGQTLGLPSRALLQIAQKHGDVPLDVVQRLPELLHDPLAAYRHTDGSTNVVLDARTQTGDPVIVGVRDGRVRTIYAKNSSGTASGWEQVSRQVERALQTQGAKVFARNSEALTQIRASEQGAEAAAREVRIQSSSEGAASGLIPMRRGSRFAASITYRD